MDCNYSPLRRPCCTPSPPPTIHPRRPTSGTTATAAPGPGPAAGTGRTDLAPGLGTLAALRIRRNQPGRERRPGRSRIQDLRGTRGQPHAGQRCRDHGHRGGHIALRRPPAAESRPALGIRAGKTGAGCVQDEAADPVRREHHPHRGTRHAQAGPLGTPGGHILRPVAALQSERYQGSADSRAYSLSPTLRYLFEDGHCEVGYTYNSNTNLPRASRNTRTGWKSVVF